MIDLGSNTIRLSVYSGGRDDFSLLANEKSFAGLAAYVEQGRLSKPGIQKACKTITKYKRFSEDLRVSNLALFATASLRNVENAKDVAAHILHETDLAVDMLTGEEEALLAFAGAAHALRLETGLYLDIGGGSMELVSVEGGEVRHTASVPLGCLNLYVRYVKELLPAKKEIKLMRAAIEEELANVAWLGNVTADIICGVGGTVRALRKLCTDVTGVNGSPVLEGAFLQDMLAEAAKPGSLAYKQYLRVIPDRVHTIVPGALLLDEVMRAAGARQVYVSKYGVREGYLINRLLPAAEVR